MITRNTNSNIQQQQQEQLQDDKVLDEDEYKDDNEDFYLSVAIGLKNPVIAAITSIKSN